MGESLGTVVAEALVESVDAGVTVAVEDAVGAAVAETTVEALGAGDGEAVEDSVGDTDTVGAGDTTGAADSVTLGETLVSGFVSDEEQAITVIVIKAIINSTRKRFIKLIPPQLLINSHRTRLALLYIFTLLRIKCAYIRGGVLFYRLFVASFRLLKTKIGPPKRSGLINLS
ncbi:hypothetical protein ASG89_18565 [Paenibacillus sp. Soil766]|nr:hypothetical protein ASG89_18565 [Paenibacillus sp. Soil766]